MDAHFKNMTLEELCNIMELSIPSRLNDRKDQIIENIVLLAKHSKPGYVYLVCTEDLDVPKTLDYVITKEVAAIIIDRQTFLNSGLDENNYPVIFTDNWFESLGRIYSTIRTSYKAPTVAITGTVGKTTTKEFICSILKGQKNYFSNNGNRNSFLSVAKHISEELTDDTEVYIQEIGAGTPMSIEKSATMLKPDYFVFLNVKNHHLNTYLTFDALFQDKASVDKYMPSHGKIIANYDDDSIASHAFLHDVISFGIYTDREVDYRAVNIIEKNGKLEFDILSDKETVHISLHILGKHNVYNALAAYILSRQLSISSKQILSAFRQYTPSGIRQNYKNIGGYRLYVDCYNVAFDSIRAGLDSMNSFSLPKGGRRFAVIGGENKLGPDSPSLSYEFGKSIADANVDYFFCYGREERDEESLNVYGDASSICNGIHDAGNRNAEFITDPQVLIKRLKETVKTGDIIFFKGIYLLDMPYIIDSVFGSSFTAQSEHYTKNAVVRRTIGFRFRRLRVGDFIEITRSVWKMRHIHIPDTAKGYKVYHIAKEAFANNDRLRKITFGKNVLHIDTGAFHSCGSLKKLFIPSNVKVIKNRAFAECHSLSRVIMEEGVIHIDKHAFKNCMKLSQISLPDSIGYIDKSAFEGCPNIQIICSENSYAARFAQKNNLKYIINK